MTNGGYSKTLDREIFKGASLEEIERRCWCFGVEEFELIAGATAQPPETSHERARVSAGRRAVRRRRLPCAMHYAPIDGLLASYSAQRRQIEQVAILFEGDLHGVVNYFIEGNRHGDGSRYSSLSAEQIFESVGAIAALDADYWQRTLALTNIYSCMPQTRRDAWSEQLRKRCTPAFTDENVRATPEDLDAARLTFLAEKVSGVFRGLSRHHVTNHPEGFGPHFILEYAFNALGSPTDTKAGNIHDLRGVIAKIHGTRRA